jgi:hypothetical protein
MMLLWNYRKKLWNPLDQLEPWGRIGPLIFSLAAFLLSYQSSEIIVRQEQDKANIFRPMLFLSNIEGNIDAKLEENQVVLTLDNLGQSPGMQIRQRTCYGVSKVKAPNPIPLPYGSEYTYNKNDYIETQLNQVIPVGKLSFRPLFRLNKNTVNLLLQGYLINLRCEIDYQEINKQEPRLFMFHVSILIRKNGDKFEMEVNRHLDLKHPNTQDLFTEMIKS